MANGRIRASAASTPAEGDAAATRERILLEASRLFRQRGYAATALREIAQAAGIKAGSIYYHFASKDEILVEVLDKGIDLVAEAVRARAEALPATATAMDRIGAAIEGHLWGLLENGDYTSANIKLYGQSPPEVKRRHKLVRRRYADYWDHLFEQALLRGELRQDLSLPVIRLLVIGGLNWTVEWYNPARGSFNDFVAQIKKIIFDGLRAPGVPGLGPPGGPPR